MTKKTASFNIEEYQLRGQTDLYLTTEQSSQVATVESRVNAQLDWVAQLLGWRGKAYWTNLTTTVSDKRKLLGGTFGVYQSFTFPEVIEVRNWSNQIVVMATGGIQGGQTCYLGDKTAVIKDVNVQGDTYIINLVNIEDGFLEEFGNNAQLKVASEENRPEPFVRSNPGTSADTTFLCGVVGNSLTLYPYWDTYLTTPYKFNIFIPGSRYYFNQPVYFSLTSPPLEPTVDTKYDPVSEAWYIDLPNNVAGGRSGVTGSLVWPFSDPGSPVNVSCEVVLFNWVDPSDWNNTDVVSNFIGTWGNKGGELPFNFCFDALEINGFDENKSLYLEPINRDIEFNTLLNLVYYQKTPQELEGPGTAEAGDAWWNPVTGAFSILPPLTITCGAWLEIDYRTDPEPVPAAAFTYGTVAQFASNVSNITPGSTVRILDVTGLEADGGTYKVMGITSPLPSSGEVVMYYLGPDDYFTVYQFIFSDEAEFAANSPFLPIETSVRLVDPTGLKPEDPGVYEILNLEYEITVAQAYEVILTKQYTMSSWALSPSSILRFIANTRLYSGTGDPLDGEMWWDFANPDAATRAASIWYKTAWVPINSFLATTTPGSAIDYGAVGVYLNGYLLSPGQVFVTDDYTFKYTIDGTTGLFNFSYTPSSLRGKAHFPSVLVADALTSAYRSDISHLVFSGAQYYMSPNVLDSETPLRTWKSSSLQVVETTKQISDEIYANPLIADQNSGPNGNWERVFLRLPPAYGRNGTKWAKAISIAQDFTYFGSTVEAQEAECSPTSFPPLIYEDLVLYPSSGPYKGTIYSEPYLYSNIGAYANAPINDEYSNSAVYPDSLSAQDDYVSGNLKQYDPLHERVADFSSPVGKGFGDWAGAYAVGFECTGLSGFFEKDLEERNLQAVDPPVWDASIYKYPPTCPDALASYSVDVNSFKVGYAYFAADLSAAEDGFFDIQQEVAWRDPDLSVRSGYVLPGKSL
jgi:hypothetical protein